MTKPLRVIVDAQLLPGGSGVHQFVRSLIRSLGQLPQATEQYVIIGHPVEPEWLRPCLGQCQEIVSGPIPPHYLMAKAKHSLGKLRHPLGRAWRTARNSLATRKPTTLTAVSESNGFYEALEGDLVHFPLQRFVRCRLPSVFNPHDLQHRHHPEFFAPGELAQRELIHQTASRSATAIVAESHWVKQDVVSQYGVDPQKVYVIQRGSPNEFAEPVTEIYCEAVRRKFGLPQPFALFPAQTWPHKNHLRLLEAARLLRYRDRLAINIICTGQKTDHWTSIKRRLRKFDLSAQIRFLGYVKPEELRALYRLAQFLIFPSLFEGGGFPIVEAFSEGIPVACSNATSLPEYGGDAALYFDPTSIDSIADALRRMIVEPELRVELRAHGTIQAQHYRWDVTARTYRALYRRLGGQTLAADDQRLLESAQ
jgi:glycosyltransferase involved in cell wall biosynthesis